MEYDVKGRKKMGGICADTGDPLKLPSPTNLARTVSWWIRILNSIENVPQVHFSIEFNFKL
jgi:hypothetical protein